MALKLRSDRAQLLASLGFNFAAKLPGVAAVFIILPLVSRALGADTYGKFLSAMALGSVCNLPFGGITTVGRRLLATAYGSSDKLREASAFMSTVFSSGVMALILSVVAAALSYNSWGSPMLCFISVLPILAAMLNTFDNMRASYNEHYVTANFQLIFQIAIYGLVYFIGLPQGALFLSGMTLQSPYMLASLVTGMLLLMQRPYLLIGKTNDLRGMVIPALGVIMADGALSALLNFSVYWLGRSGAPAYAAWDGTFVRLFQSFMSPVLLIMFPLTSYIAIRWANLTTERRMLLHKLFILAGIGYGVIVALAMAAGGSYYIKHMFAIPVEGDATDILALTVFMGAVIAQKAYTLLLYSISEARRVSFGTAIVALMGFCAAAISSHWLAPQKVIDVLFLTTGIILPILLIVESFRQHSTCRLEAA